MCVCVSHSPISQFLPLKFGLHQQTYVLIPSWHTPLFRQGGGLHWSPSTHKYKTHKHRFRAEGVLSLHCENSSYRGIRPRTPSETETWMLMRNLRVQPLYTWKLIIIFCFFATYSFLIILKHLPGLLHRAEFLFTLSLQVVFVKHFLKMAAVVPALAKQHRVCRPLRHKYSSWKGNKRRIIQTAPTFIAPRFFQSRTTLYNVVFVSVLIGTVIEILLYLNVLLHHLCIWHITSCTGLISDITYVVKLFVPHQGQELIRFLTLPASCLSLCIKTQSPQHHAELAISGSCFDCTNGRTDNDWWITLTLKKTLKLDGKFSSNMEHLLFLISKVTNVYLQWMSRNQV